MALTVTLTSRGVEGSRRVHRGTIAFDNSYPTNGEAIAPKDVGLSVLQLLTLISDKGIDFVYDSANAKIKAGIHRPQLTVVGGQGAVSAVQIAPDSTAGVIGKTAATTRILDVATDGFKPAVTGFLECINTQDLSTLTAVPFVAIGY